MRQLTVVVLRGHDALGCTVGPWAGDDGGLMADQEVRVFDVSDGGNHVQVRCRSTAALKVATDEACGEVRRTIRIAIDGPAAAPIDTAANS